MTTGREPRVTDEDKARWALQVEGLKSEENDDEGTPEWRAMMVEQANRHRAARGIPPLKEWWEDKGELQIHERARALGLLRPVR